MITTDSHTHSTFSHDGHDTVDTLCRSAIERGITHLTITDHVDGGFCHPTDGNYYYSTFRDAVESARQLYPQLTILKGIEFGEIHLSPEAFATIQSYDLDCIIGSVHRPGMTPLTNSLYRDTYTTDEVFECYFSEVCAMLEHGGFDLLGHPDLPVRYFDTGYTISNTLERLMRLCVQQEIVPEINTSTLRKGYPNLMPSDTALALYVDCGGQYIACGSDAHHAEDIAADFDILERTVERFNLIPVFFKDRRMREWQLECCV